MRKSAVAVVLSMPAVALAGMPHFMLTELAEERLQAISFFIALYVLVSAGVWGLWRRLRRDVPRLPQLTFGASLAMVFLIGLALQLVLSMIAGGRELMTPGAWEKRGVTHRIAPTLLPSDTELVLQARRQRLDELRVALWAYAAEHGRMFPATDTGSETRAIRWRVLGDSGLNFIYVGGQQADASSTPLAYEPGIFGRERWVLFANGDIQYLPIEAIHRALMAEATP